MIRTTVIFLLVLAAGALAQPAGPGRGPGRFGPGPDPAMGPMGRFLGAEAGMPGRVVKNAPYTADVVSEVSQTLPDGNRIKQTGTVHVARDSEGRTRREQALENLNGLAPNARLPHVVFINDPVAGANYALNPTEKTATKSAWVPRGGGPGARGDQPGGGPRPAVRVPGAVRVRPRPNVKTEALGRQSIEGVPADGTRTTMTIPAGQVGNEQPILVVTETWYSPDLQTVVLSKRSDPRSGDTVTRITNVTRAEPPRTLFDVPADFKLTDNTNRPGRGPRQ
ncbi:MAG TPA: hypothetical protein VE959_30970 [Bryobacteraceae bacterium]|nr:hypothetical protein [Bryobacteraceae bacterium]